MNRTANNVGFTPLLVAPVVRRPPSRQHRSSHAASSTARAGPALVTPLELSLVLSDVEREYFREVMSGDELNVAAPCDFFQLLNVGFDATPAEVRAAYRALQLSVHPDIVGDAANEMAVILNMAYATLADSNARAVYSREAQQFRREGMAYDGRSISRWRGGEAEQRAVFVDETSCIGCTHCTACAPNTFFMEQDWGRARVHTQWGDDEGDIREAIDMCPVDCISYVKRGQLALLEFVLKACAREDTAIMARRRSGNLQSKPGKTDPFMRAESWLRQRKTARVDELGAASAKSMLTEESAAAMARAWLKVPAGVREQAWPAFNAPAAHKEERVAFFGSNPF